MARGLHRRDISDRAWKNPPLAKRKRGEGMSVIPGNLSTVYSESCTPESPGGTCRKHTETGRIYTAGSAAARKHLRAYDEYPYELRHLVENAFLLLKRWRGIAARYGKNAASFAAVQIHNIAIRLLIY